MLFSNLCRHSRFAFFTPLLDASGDEPEDVDIPSGGGVKRAWPRVSEISAADKPPLSFYPPL
jgi:hypothetical protein